MLGDVQFGRILGQLFPEEFPAIHDLAAAHMKEIHGQHAVFMVIAVDVRIVAVRRGHALSLLHLAHGDQQIAVPGGEFEELRGCCCLHALFERAAQFCLPAFQEHLCVAHCLPVVLGRGEVLDARSQAALDVVLQAGPGMVARKIDLATRQEKAAVDQVDHPVRQVAGEKGSVVCASVLAQPAGHKNLGVPVSQGQLDVGVGLIVAQQDVEARLALLDEVVFERQRLMFVFHQDVIDVHGLAHERARLGICLGGPQQVRTYPGTKVFRFADVDHVALRIAVQIHPWPGRQGAYLLVQIHGMSLTKV